MSGRVLRAIVALRCLGYLRGDRVRMKIEHKAGVIRFLIIAAVLLAQVVGGQTLAAAATPMPVSAIQTTELPPPPALATHAKLDTQLLEIARAAEGPGGLADGVRMAREKGVTPAGDRVRVVITSGASRTAARAAAVLVGGSVEAEYANLVQASVPIRALRSLADVSSVSYVGLPAMQVADATTDEGVAAANASAWQAAGITGAGVKVAIIDGGFAGYTTAQANGDLPGSLTTVDYCGGTMGSPETHGTAVAEIVYKMAPGAQIYLICENSPVTLGNAKDYAIAQGIKVISHSVSWFNTSRGDGSGASGSPDAIVADARAHGILWVNSAGNYAQQHWSGTFTDANGDRWNDFAPGDALERVGVAAGEKLCVQLKWDSWPATSQDFNLYLYQQTDLVNPIASSVNLQSGSQPPTESFCYTNPTAARQYLAVAIYRYAATAASRFDLFLSTSAVQYLVAAGSLTEPGSSPNAMAVGAICVSTDVLEPYSSQGPTIDGRTKPDIAGQDATSSAVSGAGGCSGAGGSGSSGFLGTSASAPHVAGAAALVLQGSATLTPAQLQAFLEGRATDLGPTGKDNQFGAGKLALGAPTSVACTGVALTPTPSSPAVSGTSVTWTASASGCTTAQYQFWVTAGGSPTNVRDWSTSPTFNWTTTGLAARDYVIEVLARSGNSGSWQVYHDITYTLSGAGCTGVSLTPNPISPQAAGATVTWTAGTACATPEFQLWILAPSAGWRMLRDWNTAASFPWDSTGGTAGDYTFEVLARGVGSTAAYESYLDVPYRLTAPTAASCASTSLTPNVGSPQIAGASVTFTATATNCSNPQFDVWLNSPSTGWAMVRDWNASPTWIWNTTGAVAGSYVIEVHARQTGSTAAYEAYADVGFTLTAGGTAPCSAAALSPSPTAPQAAGTTVMWTASASACSSPQFDIWMLGPAGGWHLARDWSSSATWPWDTTALAAGTYTFEVHARQTGSAAAFESFADVPYSLTSAGGTTCSAATFTPDRASPQVVGTTINWTANATGCTAPQFDVWLNSPSTGWLLARDWSTATTFAWDTTGATAGGYTFEIHARQTGSVAAYESYVDVPYALSATALGVPCSSTAFTPDLASPRAAGTTVTWTATASGCASAEFQIWLLPPGGGWGIVRDWSTAPTYAWITTGAATGSYIFELHTRQVGSAAAYEAYVDVGYVLSP